MCTTKRHRSRPTGKSLTTFQHHTHTARNSIPDSTPLFLASLSSLHRRLFCASPTHFLTSFHHVACVFAHSHPQSTSPRNRTDPASKSSPYPETPIILRSRRRRRSLTSMIPQRPQLVSLSVFCRRCYKNDVQNTHYSNKKNATRKL